MEDPTVAVAKVSEIQNSRKRKRWRVSFEVPFKNRFFLENLRITHTSNSNWSPPPLVFDPHPRGKAYRRKLLWCNHNHEKHDELVFIHCQFRFFWV